MSLTPNSSEADRVSKVTFSPINSEAIVVSIRSVMPKPGEIIKMDIPKQTGSPSSKKKSRSRSCSEKLVNKSTMTDYKKEISIGSQTSTSAETVPQKPILQHRLAQQTPCLKHAAENISLKSADISSEKMSLCNNCSKSMLSYVFVVQDFLDSLANEICGGAEIQECVQCMREQVRQQMIARSEESTKPHTKHKSKSSNVHGKPSDKSSGDKILSRSDNYKRDGNTHRQKLNSSQVSSTDKSSVQQSHSYSPVPSSDKNAHDFLPPSQSNQSVSHTAQSQSETHKYHHDHDRNLNANIQTKEGDKSLPSHQHFAQCPDKQPFISSSQSSNQDNQSHQSSSQEHQSTNQVHQSSNQAQVSSNQAQQITVQAYQTTNQTVHSTREQRVSNRPESMFGKIMERQQPYDNLPSHIHHGESDQKNYQPQIVTSPFSEETDGIISGLSNVERDVYDSARNGAGWEGLVEAQERLVAPDGRILSEAYVTMCRNNAEALGCLVLGTSLLLTHTSRTLCVVISDGVSRAFRGPLSTVFHSVQTVRAMDSLGTTKLALLEQPELGISFDKLNVWRLKQFQKCVFLNPDTLVIQNCDELFNREELSAVPDVGWPDCFNSGVFVFSPSDRTFWQMLEFSDKQESCDGGDQGLLNSYFKSWSSDINKKLSFIYNLMANVSYTYTPAFKQFGRNVKIVQFHGTFKPWHVKFFNVTGLISPTSNVHPNYVEFVNKWIKIFKGNALRQLSEEIQSYAAGQELICAVELLRFFPLPSESEAEFFLTPPSVRLRLTEMKLRRSPKPIEEIQRRKSAEFPRKSVEEIEQEEQVEFLQVKTSEVVKSDHTEPKLDDETNKASRTSESSKVNEEEDDGKLPGAEVGNYQGMKKWEQGKMDYQGTDSSDSIIKRLEYLMLQNK